MTMQQLLWQGVQELNKAGVPDPQLDARYLLLEVFHLNLASFLALKARELGKDEETEGATTKACIRDNRRFAEEREMFCRFWPEPVADIIMGFYKKAYGEYE